MEKQNAKHTYLKTGAEAFDSEKDRKTCYALIF